MARLRDLVNINMNYAIELSALSKCTERHVGAVITNAAMTKVYSVGYNGGASGLDDCMCAIDGKYGCLHAEINALIKCTTEDTNKVMFVTLSPCKQCAAAIINAGFSTVYYKELWKDPTGLNMLIKAGIRCYQVRDAQ